VSSAATRASRAETETRALPAVDIVVNNHNYARFLRAAIESALAQTHGDVTVVVVDDGSTDDSRMVIESFGDRVVPVLKENEGQASAFNTGIAKARGDIVIFLDADDLLDPRTAERVAELFRDRPGLARAHYRLAVIDETGSPTGEIKPSPHIPLPSGDLRTAMTRFPFDLARPATSGNAFSARVLDEIAPVPTGGRTAADWYVVNVAALYGPVGALDETLGCYRVHGGNQHALEGATIDLAHVRATIERTIRAKGYLQEAATRLGLPWDPRDASMCEVADRAISRKLDPANHPVPGDTLLRLVALGVRAARRRFDIGVGMKVGFAGWLACLAVAPRPVARRLAEVFVFPERRRALNGWIAKLHRRR
jgi:CTP:molybdopterin cytidylyltransferase MocA